MAYQTGTASSQEDLMNVLQTFAAANGWTVDIMSTTNDWMALNNGSVFVQFRWDNSTGIAMFQSTAFSGTGIAPGNHTGDDGCGFLDASAPYNSTVSSGRRITVGNGPYTAYHFFTDGTTKYIHVVLEYSPGLYRHFSFGTINKVGTWTGGQYAAAMAIGANPGLEDNGKAKLGSTFDTAYCGDFQGRRVGNSLEVMCEGHGSILIGPGELGDLVSMLCLAKEQGHVS